MPSGYEGGRRERLADFVGFTATNSSKTRRPDALTFDYLTAFCPGPVANGDTSQGVISFAWRCRVDNPSIFDLTGRVYISRQNDTGNDWEPEVELFTFTGDRIDEIDIAFEQAGRPVVCAERNGHIWLYWYNTISAAFEFTDFAVGRTPRVILDAPFNITSSDVLLFYLSASNLVFRQQQDRYGNEIVTPFPVDENYFIEDVVKLRDSRIRVDLSHRNSTSGKYTYETITSTLYPLVIGPDSVEPALSFVSADLVVVIIEEVLFDIDSLDPSFAFVSGILAEPLIDVILPADEDNLDPSFAFISGILADATITKVLFDIGSLDPSLTFISGTLIVIVIEQGLFDRGELDPSFEFVSGTLETV